jgi:hypothetical protein
VCEREREMQTDRQKEGKGILPYYFEYKMPSNLRCVQLSNVGKVIRCTFLEFKTHLNFSAGKNV